jgi:formate dehydrogenase subunit gamma
VLHAIQREFGHVPDAAVPRVADGLNLSRAEVHGVIGFYHHFRREPPGRHLLRLCRAEACQAAGGEALAEQAKRTLGCGFHETSADGAISLEPVYCLGHCAAAPALMIDADEPRARVAAEDLADLLARLRDES